MEQFPRYSHLINMMCIKFYRFKHSVAFLYILIASLLAAIFLIWIVCGLPSIDALSQVVMSPSVRVTDRNGQLLYEIIPQDSGRNNVLDAGNIPQCLKDATIAVEDQNFYTNPGVDATGIIRAIWLNIRSGETISGGSTITQQVVRNLLLDPEERTEHSLRRKLREAILAWQMTKKLSKDEILALYLNQMNYGGMAYGIEAASQTYFGRPTSELLLSECALIAGLPQAPGIYNPFTNPDLAKQRQSVVLGLMEKQGFISPDERLNAESTPLSYNPIPYPIEAPHFIWMIKEQLEKLILDGRLNSQQSIVIRTTLDLNAQHLAEETIQRHIAEFQNENVDLDQNVNNAALVMLDPRNGEILALVGSADFFDESIDGALNMATSPRQTGSTFKPFVYALALDPAHSDPWTAATSILDVSTTFPIRDGTPYTPINYDGLEHGPVPVRMALGSSLNIPAVKTLEHVGIENTIDLAHRLGISSLEDAGQYDLSLVLGGGQVSLLELSTAYGALANQGYFTGNTSILDIHDANGQLLYITETNPALQVLDPRVAWLISDILSDDYARITGFGLDSTLKLDRTAAVKTGTTTNFHDNWTVGYTPDLLVGVWVGNSGYEAMHNVTGLTGAAPIWHEVMRGLLQGQPDHPFEQPGGLNLVEVCAVSGLLPAPACANTRPEWFIAGTEPTQTDTTYQRVWIDALTNSLADDSTPIEWRTSVNVLNLPVEAQDWARAQGFLLLSDLSTSSKNISQENQLVLVSPPPNTIYQIDPGLDLSFQQLQIEIAAGDDISEITVWVDGKPLTTLSSQPYQAWWTLAAGEHHIWAEGLTRDGVLIKSKDVIITVVE